MQFVLHPVQFNSNDDGKNSSSVLYLSYFVLIMTSSAKFISIPRWIYLPGVSFFFWIDDLGIVNTQSKIILYLCY